MGLISQETRKTKASDDQKQKKIIQSLSSPDWISGLNEYMCSVSEFLIATASQNNFGSVSSQIAMAIANSIPMSSTVEDFASAEEKKANQENKIH